MLICWDLVSKCQHVIVSLDFPKLEILVSSLISIHLRSFSRLTPFSAQIDLGPHLPTFHALTYFFHKTSVHLLFTFFFPYILHLLGKLSIILSECRASSLSFDYIDQMVSSCSHQQNYKICFNFYL